MEPRISVIVPVYNSEEYIAKTLESLLEQTMTDFEVICINDGSKDCSLEILKQYQAKDIRIKIIDKPNEGVWRARADGIKKALAPYLTFVDGDDEVEKDFLEKLYKNIIENKSDMAVCAFRRIDATTKEVFTEEMLYSQNRMIDMKINPEEVISVNTALWNKLYKTSILKDVEEIKHPPRILEDMMFLALIYLKIEKVSFVDKSLYNYKIIKTSAMNTSKKGEIESLQKAMLEIKKIYEQNDCSQAKREILASMAFLHFGVSVMLRICKNPEINFKEEYFKNLEFLNKEFGEWKKTKYLKLFYCMTHKKTNLKVAILKKLYCTHTFRLFIAFYVFLTEKLKINVKWW